MINKRAKRIKYLQNTIIILLLIGIIALAINVVLSKNVFGNQLAKLNAEGLEDTNYLLYQSIEHTFPGIGFNNGEKKSFHLNTEIKNLIGGFFFFDFKNPLSFIKAQFPAIALVTGIEFADENREAFNPQDNINQDNTSPIPTTEAPNNQMDDDDFGEDSKGIYLPEDVVIDSIVGEDLPSDLQLPSTIAFEANKPQILIYHTHGTESYKPASEGNYHTLNKEHSVIRIGEIMAEEFKKRGYEVIHDTTYHDYPSYNGSYLRSESTVKEILKKNPSIKVILDVHRDGYDHIDTDPNRNTIISNNQFLWDGKTSSKFQLVIGSATPNRKEVETFAKYIKAYSDIMYPGFSKPILVKPYGSFNQFLSNHYALLEVGSNANTIEEARLSALYIVDIFSEALDNLQ